MGGETFPSQILRAAKNAKAVIAVGSCSSYGGIPAAENNPTGAVGVYEYFKKESPSTPVVCVPGCPSHPDWFVGTLVHVLRFGMPELDGHGRPLLFFERTVHEQCPRFRDYEAKRFAKKFSDEGCLFELGCVGPNTRADCTLRKWNQGANTCIQAGAPCIGCAWEQFARKATFPLFRQNQKLAKDKGKS
jgi:hydrogenase small subunit